MHWNQRKRSFAHLTLLSIAVMSRSTTSLRVARNDASYRKLSGSRSIFRFAAIEASSSDSWFSHQRRTWIIIHPKRDKESTPSPSPSSSIVDTMTPSFVPTMEKSNSPTISEPPSLSLSPTESPYIMSSIENRTSGVMTFSSKCNSKSVPEASSVTPVLVSFDYALTSIPDIKQEVVIQTVEEVVNKQLSKTLMGKCDFSKSKSFEVTWLNSAPADVINENDTCGDNCFVVHGHLTSGIFYFKRRQLQQTSDSITDPSVAAAFGSAIAQLFNTTDLFGSNIVSLEFRGITNNAAYNTFGTSSQGGSGPNDKPNVAKIEAQSSSLQQQRRYLGWGSAVLAFAAIAVVILIVVALISRRRPRRSKDVSNANLQIAKGYGDDDLDELHVYRDEMVSNHQRPNTKVEIDAEHEIRFQNEDEVDFANDDNHIAYIVNEDVAKLEEEQEYGVEIRHNPNVSATFQWRTKPPIFVPTELDRPR